MSIAASLHHLPPSCSRCPEAEATRAKEGPTGFAARWDRVVFQRRMRMSERLSVQEPSGANPAWLAVPLVVFALITLTVGLVARQTVREPYASPFLPSFLRGYPPDEGVAGDGSVGAGIWSVTDGRTHR